MNRNRLHKWGQETSVCAGIIWKAVFSWIGLILVSATGIGFFFIIMSGDTRKTIPAYYSILITLPVLVLFHVNAIIFLMLALCRVSPNYVRSLYGVVKWIENKQLYKTKGDDPPSDHIPPFIRHRTPRSRERDLL